MPTKKITFAGNTLTFKANTSYLIALDLDGTFLHGNDADKKNFLELASQKQHKLAYVSGRKAEELESIIKEHNIPMPDFFISSNGQYLYENVNGKLLIDEQWHDILTRTGFDKKTIQNKMLEFIKQNPIDSLPALLPYNHRPTAFNAEYLVHYKIQPELTKKVEDFLSKNNIKARVIEDYVAPEDVQKSLKKLPQELKDKIIPLLDPEGAIYAMIVTAANKADSVEYLRNKLNIDKQHVVTAGNGGNDISMTSAGFWFILVSNAQKMLKDYIDKLSPGLAEKIIKATHEGTAGITEGLSKIFSVVGFA